MREWYKQHTIEGLLRQVQGVLVNVESKDEYKQLMEELLRYVGKMSYWVDLAIPWLELSQLYEITVPE
jgi:hypothetical protein